MRRIGHSAVLGVLLSTAALLSGCGTDSTTDARPTTTSPPATSTTTAPTTGARTTSYITPGVRMPVAGCALFPCDHAFHAEVKNLPVKPGSAESIKASGGSSMTFWPGFGAVVFRGSRAGYPVNVADGSAPRVDFTISDGDGIGSDTHGVPTADDFQIEGAPNPTWDRHLLIVEQDDCVSWEGFFVHHDVAPSGTSSWSAVSIKKFPLDSNVPVTDVTVKASANSLLAGLVRHEEVAAGRIDHVLAITLPQVRQGAPLWPAFHTDGRTDNPDLPLMGTWYRLKAGTDLSKLGPQARVIAHALMDHGAVLDDTGPGIHIAGEPSTLWDDADLATLKNLNMDDLEIIDPTPMIVDPGTYQIR